MPEQLPFNAINSTTGVFIIDKFAAKLWALGLLFPVFFLQSAVVSFIFSALSTLAANRVSEHKQGQLARVSAAVTGLVAALGPLWAGTVYDYIMPGAPFWMSAILLGITFLLMLRVKAFASEKRAVNAFLPAD